MILKIFSAFLGSAACFIGLWAAHLWWQASGVAIDLGYHLPGEPGRTVRRMGMDLPTQPEPADQELRVQNETAATWEAMAQSSNLNAKAARWTAASAALSGLASLIGIFA